MMTLNGRRPTSVLRVLVALAAVFTGAYQSRAGELESHDASIMRWQRETSAVTKRLSNSGRQDRNFAGIGRNPDTRTIVVYRKDAPSPDAEHGTIEAYTSAVVTQGENVEIRPALLSERETKRLIRKVRTSRRALARKGVEITGVETSLDGPVTIRVKKLTPAAEGLVDRFSIYGPGTVQVEEGEASTIANRHSASAPYAAGAWINSATGTMIDKNGARVTDSAYCTSGFGGRSTTNGKHYMITAYHCAKPGDPRFWINWGQNYVGSASVLDPGHDLVFIPADTAPVTYDGPIFPVSAQFTKPVTNVDPPFKGDRVCTSGANSGVKCYATISGYSHQWLNSPWAGQPAYDATVWMAATSDGSPIAMSGDSGGPVFTPYGNTVTAIGIISAIAKQYYPSGALRECPDPRGVLQTCSSVLYFADIDAEARKRNIDLTK